MPATTLNNINRALAAAEIPLGIAKGDCYFYFYATPGAPIGLEEHVESIYSNHLRDLTTAQYVAHAAEGVAAWRAEVAA